MSRICYMSGYGLKVELLIDFLKPEYDYLSSSDIIDEVNKVKESILCYFYGEDDYIYIPKVSPYEEAPFKSIDGINKYLYDILLPLLKEGTTLEDISDISDDVFDWDYC